MLRISPSEYPIAYELYSDFDAFFPLIAAVLENRQDGVVYVDQVKNPTQVYVEHIFGFSQIFGRAVPEFERDLHRYLLVERVFSSPKVRLYTPIHPSFLEGSESDSLRSERQHFKLDISRAETSGDTKTEFSNELALEYVAASHVSMIKNTFGVVDRFWRTFSDFVRHSNGVLAFVEGQPAALCYAAAVAGGRAEIDVLTLPVYRHLGIAKAVVLVFNQRCLEQNLLPLWDCFTNNSASMALCRSTGFIPLSDPYSFYTISR